MRRAARVARAALALAATLTACLPAEEAPLPDGGASPGGTGGGSQTDGGPAPPAPVAFPTSPAGCAADAVELAVELEADGPFTRGDAVPIRYTAYAHGIVHIFGRAEAGGTFTAGAEGHLTFTAGGGPDDPEGVQTPLWQGPYRVELAAQDAEGCVDVTAVEVPMVGDVAVGDTQGGLHVKGSDGRGVAEFAHPSDQRINALILAPDAPRGLIAAFGRGISGEPFLARLDAAGTILYRFAEQDPTGEALFAEGEPEHLLYDATTDEILCDGLPEGVVVRFSPLGDFVGRYLVPAGDASSYASKGFGRADGRPIAATSAGDRLFWLGGDTPEDEVFVDTGGSFNRLYAVAPALDPNEVVAVHSDQDYVNFITRYGVTGRELQTAEIGTLVPDHIIRFRDGYLTVGSLDPFRRLDAELHLLEPTEGGDRWDDNASFGFYSTGGMVWLNEAPEVNR